MVIDPATGKGVGDYAPSGFARWVTNLHRSLFLGDAGCWAVAAGAAALLVLSLSGLMLMLRRVGGWRRVLSRLRGPLPGRLHGPGDLLGLLPTGSTMPRFYSLASGQRDGFIEICVSRVPGGLCSGQLLALAPGDTVQAFVSHNPDFKPALGRKPVILIGAGTGIGPLAGFARASHDKRPMHLYFGTRHLDHDLFYGPEMEDWQKSGQLASVTTAFSRANPRAYVQDAMRADAARIAQLIGEGAQIMVCGGRDMAAGVASALAEGLAPTEWRLAR